MLIASAAVLMSSVWPSGAALATNSFAMFVPAPGLLSTTKAQPVPDVTLSATSRASTSVAPAGV